MLPLRIMVLSCVLSAFGAEGSNSPRHFSPPNGTDSLLEANPIRLPMVKPADLQAALSPVPQPAGKDTVASTTSTTVFQIQVDALSDLDAAQARKAVLEQSIGEKVDVIFDPPYYKLRLGNFATRQEAEDKLLDLAEKSVQGFVVQQ